MSTAEPDDKTFERAIVEWINTFPDLSEKPGIIEDLFDGKILAEIMHIIAPQQIELSNISQDCGNNPASRLNNLSYLYEEIEKFYLNVLGKPFDKSYVDIVDLAKSCNHSIFYKLIEYVLGAVVQCDQRDVYIPLIMTLDESSQYALMQIIEKILAKCDTKNTAMELAGGSFDTRGSYYSRGSTLVDKQNFIFSNNESRLLQKLDELEIENESINNKLDEVIDERDRLKNKLNELYQELAKKSDEIKYLHSQKDQIMKQLSGQETNEDLQNELKFKEKKIFELNKYSEELRANHEAELMNIRNELDNYKKKANQLSKLEITLDFYKEKYEDCAKLTDKVSELEAHNEMYLSKIQDHDKQVEAMNNKIKKVIEQYTAEKDKNIDLELIITKKDAELEIMKNDTKRLKTSYGELESKVFEQHKLIEQYKHDLEDRSRIQTNPERAIVSLSNAEENQNTIGYSNEDETEKELLRKENQLLSERCKNIQKDSELIKLQIESETSWQIEKLTKENDYQKEEINRLKILLTNITNDNNDKKEILLNENKKLNEEIELLKQKLDESNKNIELIRATDELKTIKEAYNILKEQNENLKKIINDNAIKLNELKNELNSQKQMFSELDDQKEEELRVLASAFHDLAIKNFELEKQVASQTAATNTTYNPIDNKIIKNNNTSPASGAILFKNNLKK